MNSIKRIIGKFRYWFVRFEKYDKTKFCSPYCQKYSPRLCEECKYRKSCGNSHLDISCERWTCDLVEDN